MKLSITKGKTPNNSKTLLSLFALREQKGNLKVIMMNHVQLCHSFFFFPVEFQHIINRMATNAVVIRGLNMYPLICLIQTHQMLNLSCNRPHAICGVFFLFLLIACYHLKDPLSIKHKTLLSQQLTY